MEKNTVKYPSLVISSDWFERCIKAEKELVLIIKEINEKINKSSNKEK